MKDLFSSQPDLPSPISSRGDNKTASGSFNIPRRLKRKGLPILDVSPSAKPSEKNAKTRAEQHGPETTNSTNRYLGSFSLESKRHVRDLLDKHPLFGDGAASRSNRIVNNTRQVLLNDPIKTAPNGGKITYQ